MSDLSSRASELLSQIRATAAARHLASERFARHQKLSLWSLVCLAIAMLLIPLVQATEVPVSISPTYLFAAQALLAVLVLIYALLVGLERFVAQGGEMKRGALELERLAQKIVANSRLGDTEYNTLSKEYFAILEKYQPHDPLDYLLTRLAVLPSERRAWPRYLWLWTRGRLMTLCHYLHYMLTMAFTVYVLAMLWASVASSRPRSLSQLGSTGKTIADWLLK